MKNGDVIEINEKYHLSEAEIADFSQRMAGAIQDLERIEGERKELMAQKKAEAERSAADARRYSAAVSQGYEYRYQVVTVVFDVKAKTKYFIRKSDGVTLKDEPMTDAEIAEANQIDALSEDYPPDDNLNDEDQFEELDAAEDADETSEEEEEVEDPEDEPYVPDSADADEKMSEEEFSEPLKKEPGLF